MKARRAARRLALDVLYEAEIRDVLPRSALAQRRDAGWVVGPEDDGGPDGGKSQGEAPAPEAIRYADELVSGVQDHVADIDALIARYANRWAIERMPVVDRNLLRMAIFELLFGAGVPVPVVINEAVELAKELSTEDSGRFINGLLGRIVDKEAGA